MVHFVVLLVNQSVKISRERGRPHPLLPLATPPLKGKPVAKYLVDIFLAYCKHVSLHVLFFYLKDSAICVCVSLCSVMTNTGPMTVDDRLCVVELRPLTSSTWLHVQALSHNPRIR